VPAFILHAVNEEMLANTTGLRCFIFAVFTAVFS
jgi:hypothetical protein